MKSHFERFFFYRKKFSKNELNGIYKNIYLYIEHFERNEYSRFNFPGLPQDTYFCTLENEILLSLLYYFSYFLIGTKK